MQARGPWCTATTLVRDAPSADSGRMTTHPSTSPLAGCYVISLRPVGAHDAMRRAAAAGGARVLALSPWRLQAREDAKTRARLVAALGASAIVIATSPMAVRAAAALQPLQRRAGQRWIAVGESTAAALRRARIDDVTAPTRMDSEGLLALSELADVHGSTIVLLTAPGGRALLAPALSTRGAELHRVDLYDRRPVVLSRARIEALQRLDAPAWLAVSSGGALDAMLAQLPQPALTALRGARVVAASERLARHAVDAGFADPVVASDARPAALLRAAAEAASPPSAHTPRDRSIR